MAHFLFWLQENVRYLKASERQLARLLEPSITAMGLQLWGIEQFSQGKHSLLRIYIESDEGVSIEDCERVSKQVSGILDVEDPIPGDYTLEVSSPGAERRLFSLDQFEAFQGSEVSIKFRRLVDGRRKIIGRIIKVGDDRVIVGDQDSDLSCPFDAIEKANIVF